MYCRAVNGKWRRFQSVAKHGYKFCWIAWAMDIFSTFTKSETSSSSRRLCHFMFCAIFCFLLYVCIISQLALDDFAFSPINVNACIMQHRLAPNNDNISIFGFPTSRTLNMQIHSTFCFFLFIQKSNRKNVNFWFYKMKMFVLYRSSLRFLDHHWL